MGEGEWERISEGEKREKAGGRQGRQKEKAEEKKREEK